MRRPVGVNLFVCRFVEQGFSLLPNCRRRHHSIRTLGERFRSVQVGHSRFIRAAA
jgi:hypothetical protein